MNRKCIKVIVEGKYLAEVPVERTGVETASTPYSTLECVFKLDTIRRSLTHGDLRKAGRYSRHFEMKPIDVPAEAA